MARRAAPVRPARKKQKDDDTLLIRSAESLGRVIGSLRRQLLGAGAPASTAPEPTTRPRRRSSAARPAKAKTAKKTAAARKTKKR